MPAIICPPVTVETVCARADAWCGRITPYSMYWQDKPTGYRADCSGALSCWLGIVNDAGRPVSLVTGDFPRHCNQIRWDELSKGDLLVDPRVGAAGHCMLVDRVVGGQAWIWDQSGGQAGRTDGGRHRLVAIDRNRYLPLRWRAMKRPTPNPTKPGTDRLLPREELRAGQFRASGDYRLILQGDGNLVIYKAGIAKWSTKTCGRRVCKVVMQADGNLVAYEPGDRPVWASHTAGRPGAYAIMQSDGNLVIYRNGKALWSSRHGREKNW